MSVPDLNNDQTLQIQLIFLGNESNLLVYTVYNKCVANNTVWIDFSEHQHQLIKSIKFVYLH